MELFYFIPALRIILGILFIISAGLKFADLKGFHRVVVSYNLVPARLTKLAAYTQPFVEFFIGWWVLSGKYIVQASYAGMVLMIIADVFVIEAYLKRKKLKNCGCYGTIIETPLTGKKVIENLIWTALWIVLLLAVYQVEGII